MSHPHIGHMQQMQPIFRCPITGCGRPFQDPSALGWHTLDHTSASGIVNEKSKLAQSRIIQHPNSIQDPILVLDTTAPAASLRTFPSSSLPTPVSAVSPIPPTDFPNVTTRPSPPEPIHTPIQRINVAWIENCPCDEYSIASWKWPPQIEAWLKKLMTQAGLSAHRNDLEDKKIVSRIFIELKRGSWIDFRGWIPQIHDNRLWRLFVAKVARIVIDMVRNGEVRQTSETFKLSAPPLAKVHTPMPAPVEHLDTQPTASSFPTSVNQGALGIWNSMDADTQTNLFRKQIRYAKDPQRMIHEWNLMIKENRREEVKEVIRADEANRSAHRKELKTSQGRSPPLTPQPESPRKQPAKTKDLNTLIEERILEMKMEREKEKQKSEKRRLEEQDNDTESKRVKA